MKGIESTIRFITIIHLCKSVFHGGKMKKVLFIILFACFCCLVSCSKPQTVEPEPSGETGVINIAVHLDKVGALTKTTETTAIEITELDIELSAEGQSTHYDTIQLTGGMYARTERRSYPGLTAFVNNSFIEWTLSIRTRDQQDHIIHSGDTTFTLTPLDTVTIPVRLSAQYSMLTANFFPVRDSVTRCELQIDGDTITDTSFAKQSLLGDTVTLSYDYLTATASGIPHHLDLNVYGDYQGTERLFYRGDSTITVTSGEDARCDIILSYIGPVPVYGALAVMVVTIGRVGNTTINGKLFAFERYFLTVTRSGNGTVTPSDSVTHGIPYPITAQPFYGYDFNRWHVTSGRATIADTLSASTSVILENGDATVEAVFTFVTGGSGYSD